MLRIPYTLSQMSHSEILGRVRPTTLKETIELIQGRGTTLAPCWEEYYDGPYRRNLPGAVPNTTYLVRYYRPRFTEGGFVYDIPAARIEEYDSKGDKTGQYYFQDLDEDGNASMLSTFTTIQMDDGSKVLVVNRFEGAPKLSTILEIHSSSDGRVVKIFQGHPKATREEGWFEVK